MKEKKTVELTEEEELRLKEKKAKEEIALKKMDKFFIIFSACIISAAIGIKAYAHFNTNPLSKVNQIHRLVQENYYGEVDKGEMEDVLANAYMDSLDDKYAFYQDSEGGERIENEINGNTVGIGVTVYNDTDNKALAVFRVDSESPADEAGIKVGDKIIAIDGKTVAELGFDESTALIEREVGKTAEIKLLRNGEEQNVKVVYKDFVKQTVYYETVKDYGYITITDFNNVTPKQFKEAYEYLNAQKVKGLIFDLRDNGGGTVDSVCEILDILLGECDLVTFVYYDDSKEVKFKSDSKKCELPMAVLTNGHTASASELFAANLRNVAKAPLIGNKTYGKGVVQRTYFLEDDSCIRFTVGEFLPAGGKGFNGVGLEPDVEVSFTKDEAENFYTLGENDPYLKKAIEQLSSEEN